MAREEESELKSKASWRRAAALTLLALVCAGARAAAPQFEAPKFVKVETSIPKRLTTGKAFTLAVAVTVDAPYHIQANPTKEGYIPTELHIGPAQGVRIGKVTYPKGAEIAFAGEKLSAYEGKVTITAPVTAARPGTYTLPVSLRYQGCNQTNCFPPATAAVSIRLVVK